MQSDLPAPLGRTFAATASDSHTAFRGRKYGELVAEAQEDLGSLSGPNAYIDNLMHSQSLLVALWITIEAGLFRHLTRSPSPLAASELARELDVGSHTSDKETAEREECVGRLLRCAAVMKLVDEVAPLQFQVNELTSTASHPGFEAAWLMMFNNMLGPKSTMTECVAWVKDNGYRLNDSIKDGPFQRAHECRGKWIFDHWNHTDPVSMSRLSAWMGVQSKKTTWAEWFPAEDIFGQNDSALGDQSTVFLVDIGGSLGHDIDGLARRYPDQKMRLVLQDQPSVLAEIKKDSLDGRIELQAHDFFTPQPVKGARIYYFHKVLHDWPDAETIQILQHIRDAMSSDSRLFVNEQIVPATGANLLNVSFDMTMMVHVAGKERDEVMWMRLIGEVGGLTIKRFWQPPSLAVGEGIVEIVKRA